MLSRPNNVSALRSLTNHPVSRRAALAGMAALAATTAGIGYARVQDSFMLEERWSAGGLHGNFARPHSGPERGPAVLLLQGSGRIARNGGKEELRMLAQGLAVAGIRLPYTTAAVVLSQTFVAMPFLVVGLEGALRTAGGRYEQVAATLGAGPWLAFRRVTLPLLLPALGSSLVLTFARALGEFGATITFAGSLQGSTRTLPLAIYTTAQSDVDAAVAMSLLLVVVALLVIVIARPRAVEGRL